MQKLEVYERPGLRPDGDETRPVVRLRVEGGIEWNTPAHLSLGRPSYVRLLHSPMVRAEGDTSPRYIGIEPTGRDDLNGFRVEPVRTLGSMFRGSYPTSWFGVVAPPFFEAYSVGSRFVNTRCLRYIAIDEGDSGGAVQVPDVERRLVINLSEPVRE